MTLSKNFLTEKLCVTEKINFINVATNRMMKNARNFPSSCLHSCANLPACIMRGYWRFLATGISVLLSVVGFDVATV